MERIKHFFFTWFILFATAISGIYIIIYAFDGTINLWQHVGIVGSVMVISAVCTCEIWKNEL